VSVYVIPYISIVTGTTAQSVILFYLSTTIARITFLGRAILLGCLRILVFSLAALIDDNVRRD
jgi:hypothetical protein